MLKRAADKNLGEIARTLIRFCLPLILSGILQQLYNWVDAFIVGNVEGELALAAIGATTMISQFFVMAITGFTVGLAILFAQKFGAGQLEDIPRILATFTLLLGAVFLVLAVAGFQLAAPVLHLMHTTADTVALAEAYLSVIFIGFPFLAVYNTYAAALRGIGDSRAPFLAIFVSSLTNVVLDILFVAVLHWNVRGAAVATVFSQAAMTVFIVIYGIKKHPPLRFQLQPSCFDCRMLRQGAALGVPPMIQSTVIAFGNLILQNFMNGFQTQTVAAITTAYRVDSIVLQPVVNNGSGISTLVAQSKGAGDEMRALRILQVGTGIMAAVCLLTTVTIIPAGSYLIAMFGAGPEAVEIGRNFFQRIAAFYIVYGLATSVRGYLEGMGDVVYSSLAGILSLGARILFSYTLVRFYGNMVIAYAEAYSWGILLTLYLVRFFWRRRKVRKAAEISGQA